MKPGLRHILPWLVLAAACCVPAQRAGVERPVPEPAPVRVQLLFAGDVMPVSYTHLTLPTIA